MPDWQAVIVSMGVPLVQCSRALLATVVVLFGTTTSPYLVFWQTSQEVEEQRALGKSTARQREGATKQERRVACTDILTGMLFSNAMLSFIILTTTAATLHAHRRVGGFIATGRLGGTRSGRFRGLSGGGGPPLARPPR
ncbi:divalent metal cation transporter [Synechococcus sp. CCY 9618]|uniref:divalent metal cation transporter n=1 Tax=Synechococcus sp. CCY 9618 TaxID=2815602 RepID=UPI001C24A0D4